MTTEGLFPIDANPRLIELSRSNIPGHLPEAIKRRLVNAGLMDANTGATRRARARLCEGCKTPIYRGIDADYAGRSVDVDHTPVNATGELLAVWLGRRTYQMRWDAAHGYEIDYRDSWRMSGAPAGTEGIDVMIQHKCGAEPVGNAAESMLKDQPVSVNTDVCPY